MQIIMKDNNNNFSIFTDVSALSEEHSTSSRFLIKMHRPRLNSQNDETMFCWNINSNEYYLLNSKVTYYPLTSLDIVCHEIGHGITYWKGSRLEYWKESGAMNEAYSDILGKTISLLS